MNISDEISFRLGLLEKARRGEKLTPSDRIWLASHPIYHRTLNFPYLNTDIIQISPNVKYAFTIELLECTYSGRILPVVSAPAGMGKISTARKLNDYNGVEQTGKPVKMLGCKLARECPEFEFTYQSKIGVLGISYECEYYDPKHRLIIRKDSNTGDPNFAMIREQQTDSKVIYRCKSPSEDELSALVFSMSWFPVAK